MFRFCRTIWLVILFKYVLSEPISTYPFVSGYVTPTTANSIMKIVLGLYWENIHYE